MVKEDSQKPKVVSNNRVVSITKAKEGVEVVWVEDAVSASPVLNQEGIGGGEKRIFSYVGIPACSLSFWGRKGTMVIWTIFILLGVDDKRNIIGSSKGVCVDTALLV